MRVLFITLLFSLFLSLPLVAQEKTEPAPADAAPKPNLTELKGDYQIFPAGRMGNSLYHKKKRIFTRQELSVRAILSLKQGLVVYGVNQDGKDQLALVSDDDKVKLEPLSGGFYKLTAKGGVTKILRVFEQETIQDLLPRSNTAGNFVFNGEDKGAFTHITGGEQIETPEGKLRYQYSFKLHVVKADKEKITNLAMVVTAYSPRLSLRWSKKNQLQFTNGEGKIERVNIR